jgi:hypothetical protein
MLSKSVNFIKVLNSKNSELFKYWKSNLI